MQYSTLQLVIHRVQSVTAEDVSRVIRTYLSPFADPDATYTTAACKPSVVQDVMDRLDQEFQLEFVRVDDIEKSDFA